MKNGETKMSKIRNSPSGERAPRIENRAPADASERAKAMEKNIPRRARAEDQRRADRPQSAIEDRFGDGIGRAIGRKQRGAELAPAQLAAIVKSSNDAIYAVDLDGIIIFWNQGAERLYGYTAREIIGQPLVTLIPPECREMDKGIMERLMRGERIENYETLRLRKDGSAADISLTVSLIENNQGEIIGTSRIAHDIAEHKRAEEMLRKSEARFAIEARIMRDLYDSSARLQAAPDLHTALEEILQSSIRLMQADFGNIQLYDDDRKALWLVTVHGFGEPFVETFRVVSADDDTACGRAIRGGTRIVVEDVEQDELYAPYREVAAAAGYRGVQSTPLYDCEGALLGVLSTHWRAPHRPSEQDFLMLDLYARQAINFITRARAEKELRESEERFRSYFELGLIGMAITSPAKILLEVNDEICKILGYERDELLKITWAEITHPDDLAADIANFERVMAGEIDGYKLDKRFIRKDGRIIDATISVKALRAADGAADYFVSLLEDVTERKRAEKALRDSERLTQKHAAELADLHRRKDEFLAMLSHELRNPLSPILNAAHILRLQKDENPLQRQARAVIERQVNQLSRLVNDLLEVSRVITGTIRLCAERLDIRGVVKQAVESARPLVEQRRHQLFVSLPAEPVWLVGDAARLEQVVVNLLNNAAKYTDEGGNIWVNLQQEGDEVTLRVRDTGIGIAPELLPRVFDLFTQADRTPDRSQGGLGIGLSLTQRLVELHRGKIEAHSAGLGRGSEFIVRLPLLSSPKKETDMTFTVRAKRAAQSWRILVADDNVDAANMIAMMLQHFGHQTETVYSAQSALEIAAGYKPDFVVLDIGLPGMDGYEVARRLRRIPELKDTRLIAATGYGQDTDRRRSEEAGFDYHLVKPIDPEKLQTVLELLGRLPHSAKFGGRIQQ
jgi:PAS domain S-box-containing protein